MLKAPSFWYAPKGTADNIWPRVLAPLGLLYGWIVRKRFDLYFPVPLSRPVVCVGNAVAGGAGKTPVVLALTALLMERGHNPHILSRGYGGTETGPMQVSPGRDTAADVGDEPLLLVEQAPTWVSANRALGAQAAIDTGASVIVMDDGFQNPSLYKDFSLLVVDGATGFGNGRVMPAGPLREEVSFALSRASAAVIVGEDKSGAEADIRKHANIPLLRARIVPDAGNPDLSSQKIFAFAGIGRPEKFRETLEQAGAIVEGWSEFPDHFAYIQEDLAELMQAAAAQNTPVFTTTKDYVRLPVALRDKVQPFRVRLEWENADEVVRLVESALQRSVA